MIFTDEMISKLKDEMVSDYQFFYQLQEIDKTELNYDNLLDNMNCIDRMAEEEYFLSIAQF